MRILQVVGLISPHAEYGGPTQVALTQAKGLIAAGHDVVVAAGAWGFDPEPSIIDDVPVRLFRARALSGKRSVRGLASPELVGWVWSNAARFDAVHIHLARDFVTMPSAWGISRRGVNYVVQTHGMVTPRATKSVRAFDAMWTRSVLRNASRAFCLTADEMGHVTDICPGVRSEMLRNGVDVVDDVRVRGASESVSIKAVTLARLHRRKRHANLVRAAAELAVEFPESTYVMIGPDEGEAAAVEELICSLGVGGFVRWDGALQHSDAMRVLGDADLFVLPSVDEPYPVAVLEALSRAVPVIISDSCGLASVIASHGGGLICQDSVSSLAAAVREMHNPRVREREARRALRLARQEFSVEAVVQQLLHAYADSRLRRRD